jgi:uncharacterized protein
VPTPSATGPTTSCSTSTSSTARPAGPGLRLRAARPTTFRDTDHLGPQDAPVRAKLERWLASQGVELPAGPVRVLTNLRVLGHVFNPVSWWFCHHPDGSSSPWSWPRSTTPSARRTATSSTTFARPWGTPSRRDGPRCSTSRRSCRSRAVLPLHARATGRPGARAHGRHDAEGPLFDATQAGRRVPLTSQLPGVGPRDPPAETLTDRGPDPPAGPPAVVARVPFHRKPEPPPSGFDPRPGRPARPADAPPHDHRELIRGPTSPHRRGTARGCTPRPACCRSCRSARSR